MEIELKLGSEFFAGEAKLVVAKGEDCDGCFFNHKEGCGHMECQAGFRKDMTDVIYVESNLPDVSGLPAPPEAEVPAEPDTRSYNVGASDYSKHAIQPWDIWNEYKLNPYDADITKRTLRKKTEPGKTWEESRILDYKKIIHVCQERIRQLESGEDPFVKEDI